MQDIASKEECSMPVKLAGRIAEKSGRNLRRAVLLAESCRVQNPTLQPNQDIQASWQSTMLNILGPKRHTNCVYHLN